MYRTGILVALLLFVSCKNHDKEASPKDNHPIPDNKVAINNAKSNNSGDWKGLSVTKGTSGSIGGSQKGSLDAETSAIVDRRSKYYADSMATVRLNDSLRMARKIDSIRLAELRKNTPVKPDKNSTPVSPNRGVPGANAGSARVAKTVKKENPMSGTGNQQKSVETIDDFDDFHTIKVKSSVSPSQQPNDRAQVNTFKESAGTGKIYKNLDVSIRCVIGETVFVKNGGTISVKTVESIELGEGLLLPAGSRITGFCDVSESRVSMFVKSVNINGKIYSVNLKAYDEDGADGIAVKQAATKRNTSNGLNQTLSTAGQILTSGSGVGSQLSKGMVNNMLSSNGQPSISIEAGKKVILRTGSGY